MILRIRYKKLGGLVHCRVFTARDVNQTFAKCGDLVFFENEWPAVQLLLSKVQITPESDILTTDRLKDI